MTHEEPIGEPQHPAGLDQKAQHEKRSVAFWSVLAAILLTGMKLVVGIATGSLGILSEAAHSGLDLVAAVVTLFAVRVSSRPADRDHNYGHGKIENLSALFETLLLLGTCVWIVIEAIDRLFYKQVEVDATFWSFAIMVISIVVDFSRSRALSRAAKKYDSQALEADALHFSTDIWSSAVVLLGLFLVLLAEAIDQPWLRKADTLAALGVAMIVVWVSIKLGRKTIGALLDEVPPGVIDEIHKAVQIPQVVAVTRVRVRKSGPEAFVDICLSVDSSTSLEQGHAIAHLAENEVHRILPSSDVVVHVEPVATKSKREDATLHNAIRETAHQLSLGAHSIRIHEVLGKRSLEVHLEVDDSLNVAAAHHQACAFEKAIRERFPNLDSVISHIEPTPGAARSLLPAPPQESEVLEILKELMCQVDHQVHPHEVKVHQVQGEFHISLHCTMDAERPITDAHAFTEKVEHALRARMPQITHVLIHVEPPEPADMQE